MREEARTRLAERLRSRNEEIAEAALIRVHAVSGPTEIGEGEYREGLPGAVAAALEHGAAALECPDDRSPPVPTRLLGQARLAARNRITLDAVLRRYIAGYTVFGDFVIEAAQEQGVCSGSSLKRALRVQAALFDRLLGAVTEEYNREAARPGSSAERRMEQVRRLLAGELLDAPGLRYDFDAHHVGLIATGDRAEESLREMLAGFDCRLLIVAESEKVVWAWLGITPGDRPRRDRAPVHVKAAEDRDRRAGEGPARLAPHPPPGKGGPADRLAELVFPYSLQRGRPARLDSRR